MSVQTERHVLVQIGGVPTSLAGPAAELVALVAAGALSPRALRLLALLAADAGRLDAIDLGRVVVDLAPGALRVRFEDQRPRVAVATG